MNHTFILNFVKILQKQQLKRTSFSFKGVHPYVARRKHTRFTKNFPNFQKHQFPKKVFHLELLQGSVLYAK